MPRENVIQVLNDPLAQELLHSAIPARLAYIGADGFPLKGARKLVAAREWPALEAKVRAMYTQMARITIVPEWAKLLDFETRFPSAIEELVRPDAGRPAR